ncbi:MAG TPA: L,D-transpeptidase [Devosia sp.]|nr:L,D-transpeptidase [Devosia sp.]
MTTNYSRRAFLVAGTGLAALTLAGCSSTGSRRALAMERTESSAPAAVREMYAALPAEPYPVPAVQLSQLNPQFWRQVVDNPTGERAGTVVVDTPNRYLYWTLEGGKAMRYGVGIGREGFAWNGRANIGYKREWPRWTPPSDMIKRQPELEIYRNGMEPGLENPLGARALYIFQNGRDTLYRLHATLDARTIGQAVSSGCVRLLSQDVIDLYNRVPSGSPVVVLQ